MRRVLIIVVVLVVVALGLAFAALRAINSDAGRTRLAAELSRALGQPVAIGGMSLSPLPTPSLHARDVRIGGADSTAAPGLAVRELAVVPSLASFLPGRTRTIDRVDLVGLLVSVRRDRTGRWHLPVAAGAAAGRPAGETGSAGGINVRALRVRDGKLRVVHDSVGPKASSTVTTITDVDADLEATGGALRVPRFTGALGQTRLTGVAEAGPTGAALRMSTESVRNADLPALFALAGLEPYPGLSIDGKAPFEMSASLPADFAGFVVTGKAAVDRVRLGTMSLEQVQAPFRFERGRFTLDPLGFTMYGGRQQGSVAIDLTRSVPVYTIKSAITGLDVNRALSATTTMKDFLTGSARMTANLTGSGSTAPAIQRSLTGNVKFELRDGVLRNFPLAAAINQALGITEGNSRDTKFELMSASAVVGGGRARSDDLLLRAGDLGITGKGVLGFDRTLDFQLRAALSAARSGQLAQKVALLQHLTDDQGQISMPVSVSGTATNPKTSVDVGTVAKKQVKEQVQKGLLKLLEKH